MRSKCKTAVKTATNLAVGHVGVDLRVNEQNVRHNTPRFLALKELQLRESETLL